MTFLRSPSSPHADLTPDSKSGSKAGLADGWILLILWFLAAAFIVTWAVLDKAPPAWDQGDHLSRAARHWRVLQHPQLLSGEWWRELWTQAPTQRAPFAYLMTSLVFMVLGAGFDQGIYANLLFTAILLGSTYGLGRCLFSPRVGLWAAGFSLLSPILIDLQRDYLLDYPMTGMVSLMFMTMTLFWMAEKPRIQWLTTPLWGVGLGLMLMTRTSGLLFAIPPVAWMLGTSLFRRRWHRLLQVVTGLGVSLLTIWPWFSTNWLTVISTTLESTSHGVLYRNDPQANTLAGWLYYIVQQPKLLSWALFVLAAIAWLLVLLQRFLNRNKTINDKSNGLSLIKLAPEPTETLEKQRRRKGWAWLSVFLIGTYLLFTLGSYKALRVYVPYLSIFWVFLAPGILAIQNRWWRFVRWAAVGVALLMAFNQFFWSPTYALHQPKPTPWPNENVIDEMVTTTPYLNTNLGIVANTIEVNPFNLNFYGAVANEQVFARQLSFSPDTVPADSQALDWYLTKTEYQGSYENIEAGQQQLRETIEASSELPVHKAWPLPDGSEMRLHRRQNPPITVERMGAQPIQNSTPSTVSLSKVKTAAQVSPGQAYPITYHVRGPGLALEPGLLVLSWKSIQSGETAWISDHAIGLGYLNTATSATDNFEVVEKLSFTVPASLAAGTYRLKAEYLNRKNGTHYILSDSATQVEVVADTVNTSENAPENTSENATSENANTGADSGYEDLLSYLHTTLAPKLRNGDIDPLFSEVGRINQYDPTQDYLRQAERAMTFRLTKTPDNPDWLYTLVLAQVLQQKASSAISTLQTLTKVVPDNANNWAYLGLVHLYQWQPRKAYPALTEAEKLQPDLPNLKLLQAVNAAMNLNIPKAVRLAKSTL